jgi:uncharacterized membrane protein
MRRYTFAVAAVLLVLFPWRQATLADAPRYSITNLGTLDDLVPTVTGVNASGQVSGYVSGPAGLRAVRYTNGAWQYLPGLDSTFSVANGINAAGDLVGYYANAEGAVRAYRYHANAIEEIAPLPNGSMTLGFGINARGDVVGYADAPEGIVGFIARPGELAKALPSLGGTVTIACGINDAGQVAGSSVTALGVQHAVRIDDGQPSPVDIGSFTAAAASSGCAIDADGRVGGQLQKDSAAHAFRFHNGVVEDLDTFGSPASNVESIANGVSVGYFVSDTGLRAFVSSDDAGTADLNTLADDAAGWFLSIAKGVNANGVIVGEGTFNGQPAVFRLTPQAKDTTPPSIANLAATPSAIWPPKGQMVPVSVTFTATDDSGETPACALTGIAGPGSSPNDYALTGPQTAMVRAVGGSTYTLTETCVDAAGNGAATSVDVVVPRDASAPTITSIWATPSHIWPPNNKMVPVSVHVTAIDDVDDTASCSVTSVSGAPSSDYEITGRFTANVRASKNSDGSSRVYSLKVSCTDAAGNRSTAVARVSICKDPAEANKK